MSVPVDPALGLACPLCGSLVRFMDQEIVEHTSSEHGMDIEVRDRLLSFSRYVTTELCWTLWPCSCEISSWHHHLELRTLPTMSARFVPAE